MDRRLLGWPSDGPRLRLDHRRFAYAGKFVTGDTGVAVVTESRSADDRTEGGRATDDPSADGRVTDSQPVDGQPGAHETTDDDRETAVTPRTEPPADREYAEPDGAVLAAVSFSGDRTEPEALWLRYVTVRRDRRGEGIGGQLCAFVADRAHGRSYETVRIAVNNPFSYDAAYKAGFAFTGRQTGLAELVLERPSAVPAPRDAERYRAGLDVFAERDRSDAEAVFLDRAFDRGPPDSLAVRVVDGV